MANKYSKEKEEEEEEEEEEATSKMSCLEKY